MLKDKLLVALRLVLSVCLLGYLLHYIGFEQITMVLETINPIYFLVLYGLMLTDATFRSFNWKSLLKTKKYFISLRTMFYNYVVGGFLGTFIPSSLGTDFSRAVLLVRRNKVRPQDSALAILVLNLMGLLALCMIAVISSFLFLYHTSNLAIFFFIIPVCLIYIILFPFIFKGWFPKVRPLNIWWLDGLFTMLRNFSEALKAFKDHKAILTRVLSVAFLNHFLSINIVYTVSLALNVHIPFIIFVIYVPIISLSRLIPFSFAGLGAEQGIFVLLFAQSGVPAAEAFLISLVLSVVSLSFSLVGAGIYTMEALYLLMCNKRRVKNICSRL